MTDYRIGLDLFSDVLAVLHRHGFARGDDLHAGRAIFLIGDMARIYDGSQDHSNEFSTSQSPEPPGPRTVRPRGRPERRNAYPRGGQDRPDGTGPRRQLKTRPRREVHLMRRPVLLQIPAPPPQCPTHHQLAVQLRYHEQVVRPHAARPSQTPPASQPIRRSASDY
jgi:hypothetical protein